MKVYKATNSDMTCNLGSSIFPYELGVPAYAEKSQCGEIGLHACEYIMDCLTYYNLCPQNRFFIAEAAGDIAEDGVNTRISCTELTLVSELTPREMAREALMYMIRHPKRKGWEKSKGCVMVAADRAKTDKKDGIAIARGENPKVNGCEGAHLGWVREVGGQIKEVKLVTVTGPIKPCTWYTIEEAVEAMREVMG